MSLGSDFRKFVMRGNLVDLAIGFTVGAAFGTIARSLVSDIIMPPVGLLLGRSDFSDLFIVLRPGPDVAPPYLTLADAQAAGAVTINYGLFGNAVLAFVVVAIAMFAVMRAVNRAESRLEAALTNPPDPSEPENKKCEFCLSTIPYKASRCPHCTSQLTQGA